MDKSFVTETPEALWINAEKDIMSANVLASKEFYPEDFMYSIICFHATQAVEKLLKSYIISNGKKIEKTHDLDYLCQSAKNIDVSFERILNDCSILNTFISNLKYEDEEPITKQEMNKITKSLKTICKFPPIKTMRDSFSKKHNYEIVTSVSTKFNKSGGHTNIG